MKYLLIILSFICSSFVYSQVAIGKNTVSNNSVSLEFGDYNIGQGMGIIVPWVQSQSTLTSAERGTIIFDTSDHVVKYKKTNGTWSHLSKNEIIDIDGITAFDTTGTVDLSLQTALDEKTTAKVSVGSPTNTPGILVLEDNNKAMILPKVPSPHLNVINPEPGLMVYDTDSKMLAIFNGKVWSFWKN